MIHDATSFKHSSVNLIVPTGAITTPKLWTDDAKQANSQCDKMSRYIDLIPPKVLNYKNGALLKILKYLYGLSASDDAWNQKTEGSAN